MKKFLLASCGAAALALAATGANAQSMDWSGFYAGVHAGYVGFDSETTIPASASNFTQNPSGFVGGVLAGYNWQGQMLVYGVEADIGGIDVSTDPTPGFTTLDSFDINGHVRGRIGYPMGNALLFAAAGLAVTEISTTVLGVTRSKTRAGGTIGAGVDFMAFENVVVRGEYLFDFYGKSTTVFPGGIFAQNKTIHSHTARAALIWKFGGN